MEKRLKLVVVGDSYVGKTTLLFAYTEKQFRSVYATTVFDNWSISVEIENHNYTVNLFDTAGQEGYSHLRCLSYPNTDVFLLCFSMVDPKSLDVCQTVWLPEIRKYAGDNVPVLLIGTKEDLLDSANEHDRVLFETARKAALQVKAGAYAEANAHLRGPECVEKMYGALGFIDRAERLMGCVKFLPCSALTHKGLKQVFDEAFLAGIGIILKNGYRKPCCNIL